MEIVHARHLLHTQNDLGEGPLWHPEEKCLYWVDIEFERIYKYDPFAHSISSYQLETSIGAFGFRKEGGFVLASGLGFGYWSPGQKHIEIIADPHQGRENVRMNDGKVDAAGRFWAGSHDLTGSGCLYRLDPDGSCHTMLDGIYISNGLAWSLDNSIFYYTDSGKYAIYSFDFDPVAGEISNQKLFKDFPSDSSLGVPDGLTIDSEGYIWGARWDGRNVVRYNPEGKPVLEVRVPVSRVTSVTFGGKDMQDLFITTASTGLTETQRKEQPLAGDVFVYKANVKGLSANYFIG